MICHRTLKQSIANHCSAPAKIAAPFSIIILAVLLNACVSSVTPRTTTPTPPPATLPPPAAPSDATQIPDAVPKVEPRSAKGNPRFYEVMGKRYFVLPTAEGYVERGVASRYGPGFHKRATAMGEIYDMHGMSAAHCTLPIPAYAQVTNLKNGRSVVVRINDRGPFKASRIIDLSYSAAAKLDMLRAGTAFVEVRALTPGTKAAPAQPAGPLYVQAGAYGTESNALRMLAQLQSAGFKQAFVRQDQVAGNPLFRVRIGPVSTVEEFDRIVAQLRKAGVHDARLADS